VSYDGRGARRGSRSFAKRGSKRGARRGSKKGARRGVLKGGATVGDKRSKK